jgi:pyruvate dehydrogenase E2 component (dihydrolipoamide acetyltransferase)
MAHEVVVPRLGWNMEEGVFLEWLKRDGDPVRAGENLFVLEGEKSAQEIESVDSGILRIPPHSPAPGATVAVGTVLAYLVDAEEEQPWVSTTSPNAPPSTPPYPGGEPEVGLAPTPNRDPSPASPLNKGGSGGGRTTSSPRARRVASDLGIDWTHLTGTGRTGRIRERDVRAAASSRRPQSGRVLPLSPVRKVIANRMLAGTQTTAPVTLTTKVDATNLVNLRDQFKATANPDQVPGYTDLMTKLVASALQEHPTLNRAWSDEGLVEPDGVHIGIAVDTEAGLLVPVLRDVPTLGLRQVAQRSRELIESARTRRLSVEDNEGGSFTITNLGMFGIDAFTPILNVPQCAILGMGRIVVEPALRDGQVVPRAMMVLSLTFDHRIVDGAPAARFLNTLREFVEQPGPQLIP